MSISSRPGGSRASDDDARTSVKVGMFGSTSYFLCSGVCNCLFKCLIVFAGNINFNISFSSPSLYRVLSHVTRVQ